MSYLQTLENTTIPRTTYTTGISATNHKNTKWTPHSAQRCTKNPSKIRLWRHDTAVKHVFQRQRYNNVAEGGTPKSQIQQQRLEFCKLPRHSGLPFLVYQYIHLLRRNLIDHWYNRFTPHSAHPKARSSADRRGSAGRKNFPNLKAWLLLKRSTNFGLLSQVDRCNRFALPNTHKTRLEANAGLSWAGHSERPRCVLVDSSNL